MNKLRGSRAYLAGPIDYCDNDGTKWRRAISKFLKSRGIIVLDPTEKPISGLNEIPSEIGEEKRKTQAMKDAGDFEGYRDISKKIRNMDLRMTDIADFLIVYIDQSIPMCGTWEELFNANRQKKPIIVIIKNGPAGAPLWLHGTIHYKYMFSDLKQAEHFISSIDNGDIEMDGRWHLLDHVKLRQEPETITSQMHSLFDKVIEDVRDYLEKD
jgi:nucleoside 2-deoxyribosyltransferase